MTLYRTLRPVLVIMALLAVLPFAAANPAPAQAVSDRPIMAFYYPWWELTDWTYDTKSDLPNPHYSGGDDEAIRRHIQQADDAGIDALICAWYGPEDTRLDSRCKRLIELAREGGRDLQVAILPEHHVSSHLNSPEKLANGLKALERDYFSQPNYLRINNKPAVFFFFVNDGPVASVAGWQSVRQMADPGNGQYWFGGTDQFNFLDAHDALFYYDISWEASTGAAMRSYATKLTEYNRRTGQNRPFVSTVMPGYDDRKVPGRSRPHFKDRDNGNYYRSTWQDAISRKPQFVVLSSFNEFAEGHHIEPSERYGSLYLQLTKELSDQFRAAVSGQPPTQPPPTQPPAQPPTGECQNFPETGFQVCGRILQYWRENGGLPVFGLPLAAQEGVTIEGQVYQAQEFERNRLELHPEKARPYDVLLGRLGDEVLRLQGRDWNQFPKVDSAPSGCLYFAQTRHSLCEPFLSYFRTHGLEFDGRRGYSLEESIALFGLPLSEPQPEQIEGQTYSVQWFERARFEHHPEFAPPNNVLLGRLGAERRQ